MMGLPSPRAFVAALLLAVTSFLPLPSARADGMTAGIARDYLAGLHLLQYQDFSAAATLMGRVLADAAGVADKSLRAATFNANLRAGRWSQALDVARADPDPLPVARLLLALDALKSGDLQGAEAPLQGADEDLMRKGLSPLVQAWAAAGRADRAGAIAALAPLAELSPALAAYTEGRILERLGDPAAAEAAYRRIDPEIIRLPEPVFRALARLQLKQGGAAAASGMLSAYLVENPQLVEVRHDLEVLTDKGVFPPWAEEPATEIAEALFQVALSMPDRKWTVALDLSRLSLWLDPQKDRARLLVAGILENLARYQDARVLYTDIPADSPYRRLARRGIANSMYASGDSAAAIALLEKNAAQDPHDTGALQLLGQIYQNSQDYPKMADAFARLISRAPADDPALWSYHYRRGIALERQKLFPQAEPHFLKALELSPGQPDVLNYLGYSWVDMGVNLERGLKMLESAVQKDTSGYIVDSLGWAYYKTGAYDMAVKTLEVAAAMEPREAVIFDHLGDAYWKVGRFREARFQWARALTMESPDLDAAAVRGKLAQDCPRFCGGPPGAE